MIKSVSCAACATLLSRRLARLIDRTVREAFSASQTAGANAMRRDIRDFYDLKRRRVRRQRTERDDKSINEMKISHMGQQVRFSGEISQTQVCWHIRLSFCCLCVQGRRTFLQRAFACSSRMTFPIKAEATASPSL